MVPPSEAVNSSTGRACSSRTATIGLACRPGARVRARTRSSPVASATAVGTRATRTASTPPYRMIRSTQSMSWSSPTAAVASTGLPTAAPSGRTSSRSSMSCGVGAGSVSPASAQASAASTPAPPALVTMATRGPVGSGWACNRAAASRSSPTERVAVMPAWVNSAPRVMVRVAAAAVCEAAARRPASVRPASTVNTGIRRVTRRAVREKARGLPKDSRWSRARSVRPSLSHHWSRSLPLTSYLSPREAKDETPMPSRDSPSSRAMPTPPDCTATPAVPGRGWPAAKVASRLRATSVLETPRQLGPTSRMP